MIFGSMIDLLTNALGLLLGSVDALSLPTDGIQAIATFSAYGSWVVGSDLLLVFASSVFFWMTLKLTLGAFLFVWRLLPFT